MRQLWAAENKRGIFAMLGQAYSDLRDHHDETFSLEKFLETVTPILPIVPVNIYLSKMGWEIENDNNGDAVLKRSKLFSADKLEVEYPNHTNLSVNDIVNHCYNHGLLDRALRKSDDDNTTTQNIQAGTMGMAFATAPTSTQPPSGCIAMQVAEVPATVSTLVMPFPLCKD